MNIYVDRSKEAWSEKKHPRKSQIEKQIVEDIKFILNVVGDTYRKTLFSRGVDVCSLTGPALMRHYNEYLPLLGNRGVLTSVENDSVVVDEQDKQIDEFKNTYGEMPRINRRRGDWFNVAMELSEQQNRPFKPKMYDYDTTTVFKDEVFDWWDEVLLNTDYRCGLISITMTHSYRNSSQPADQSHELIEAWIRSVHKNSKWRLNRQLFLPYRDGTPMWTCNMIFQVPFKQMR